MEKKAAQAPKHRKLGSSDSQASIEVNYNDKKYEYYHKKFETLQERQPILIQPSKPTYASSFKSVSRDRRVYQENVRLL